jgi:hypothetical protein
VIRRAWRWLLSAWDHVQFIRLALALRSYLGMLCAEQLGRKLTGDERAAVLMDFLEFAERRGVKNPLDLRRMAIIYVQTEHWERHLEAMGADR